MGSITSLKCVLIQEHLDAIYAKYFVPEEVHPQLPSSDATMHERQTGKVGMYTRFFDYVNYRIPFSTFFVTVLTHFRIPFSQLFVFGSAKERIKKTKRSKNDQNPTKNDKDKNKSEETAKDQKPDQPDTAMKAVKGQNKVKGPRMTSLQSLKGHVKF
ncbi:hypothetical protein Tco_0062146 [Tanacetum coccineum]